jgi:hypothetical protein
LKPVARVTVSMSGGGSADQHEERISLSAPHWSKLLAPTETVPVGQRLVSPYSSTT